MCILQVIKGINAPRVPDCFQRNPKRVILPESGQILAVTVDNQGMNQYDEITVDNVWTQQRISFLGMNFIIWIENFGLYYFD